VFPEHDSNVENLMITKEAFFLLCVTCNDVVNSLIQNHRGTSNCNTQLRMVVVSK